MKRILSQAIVFFALLLIVSLIRLPYGSYKNSLLPWLKQHALSEGKTVLTADDLTLSFPLTFRLLNANMLVGAGKVPVPLSLNSASATIHLLPLLRLAMKIDALAELYKGEISITNEKAIFGSGNTLNADCSNIVLGEHPVLFALGVQGVLRGKASARTSAPPVNLSQVDYAEVELQLGQGSYHETQSFLPLIKIPPVDNIEAKISGQLKKGRINVPVVDLTSSLGTIHGSLNGNLGPDGRAANAAGSFEVKLTPEGTKAFAGYFALQAGIPVDNPPSNWQVDFEKVEGKLPRLGVHPE